MSVEDLRKSSVLFNWQHCLFFLVLVVHVKMCMIDSGKTVHVRKTAKKSCADPVFNESFHFDIVDGALHHTCFEFIVANNKASLGKAFVGPEMYVTGTGLDHWKSMLQSPRNAVTMWHSLK